MKTSDNIESKKQVGISPSKIVREHLANYAHTSWSGWMKYVFSKNPPNEDGTWTMPKWAVERWQRQMNTSYDKLPEEEKKSDREEADKMLKVFNCVPDKPIQWKNMDRGQKIKVFLPLCEFKYNAAEMIVDNIDK